MTVELGMFTHAVPPSGSGTTPPSSRRIRRPIVLADRLGFTEASWASISHRWRRAASPPPLIFFATLIPRTTQIRFGTGVINLPQLHPAQRGRPTRRCSTSSGKGRFIMGIAPAAS